MLVAFSVTPIGSGEDVGALVAEAVRVVRASGLPNETTSMFTTVEGEWDEVMTVVRQATEVVAAHCGRVSLVLKADLRPGVTGALHGKVASVERRLAADPVVAERPAASSPAASSPAAESAAADSSAAARPVAD